MKKFGLIGKKLDYSYSKLIHEQLGRLKNIEVNYDLIEINNINDVDLNSYDGLNITIPYKQDIIKKLKTTDIMVDKLQSCNTVDHDLKGYNTDIDGFIYLLKILGIDIKKIKRVVIIGSGASCKMICSVFKNKDIFILSRTNGNYEKHDAIYGDVLINTSPLGMGQLFDQSPLEEALVKKFKCVIDLNYNPSINQLLFYASKNNIVNINGLAMLVYQAVKAFEIWNDVTISDEDIKTTFEYIRTKTTKGTAIIGMPLSGKSNFLKKDIISSEKYIDLDNLIEKQIEMTIYQYVKLNGENQFRDIETMLLKQSVDAGYSYVACGGGIINRWENRMVLKDYLIIDITPAYSTLVKRFNNQPMYKRPLVETKEDLKKLYEERKNKYKFFQTKEFLKYEDFNN